MNRKIFTLLAGAFLMLATVFSASAQHFQNPQDLKLGPKVEKLELGANEYYHLRVEAVSIPNSTTPFDISTITTAPYVLYMGNELDDRTYPIFIAELGKAGAEIAPGTPSYWADPASGLTGTTGASSTLWFDDFGANSLKSRESASSLWCTVVQSYDQGINITFDFTNKFEKGQMLEVDIDDYEIWSRALDGVNQSNYDVAGAVFTPGAISGWQFSDTYATGVEAKKPLFSYITADTVAVLCVDIDELMANPIAWQAVGAHVYVKIAAANDVVDGRVPGVLYFTLYEGAPFVLDAMDFNTMFGENATQANRRLTFSPDVNPSSIVNYFSRSAGLYAQHINVATPETFNLPAEYETRLNFDGLPGTLGTARQPIYELISYVPAAGDPLYDNFDSPIDYDLHQVVEIGDAAGVYPAGSVPANFDDMGYLYLKQGSSGANANNYLYAQHKYYTDNVGGSQFLEFGFRTLRTTAASPTDKQLLADYHLYGQSIWRLVYYPSGDSIYINPFQATYLPDWDNDMKKIADATLPPLSLGPYGYEGDPISWDSIIAQSDTYYTFRASLDNLEDSRLLPTNPTDAAGDRMVDRLRYGRFSTTTANKIPDFYTYYHHNYVTIQNLTGNVRIVTLGNGSTRADHTIDTHIYFNIYDPCRIGTTTRTTIPSDLYLIRNQAGQYLHIPFYSTTDSVRWSDPEPDIHPELLPSYQWVVLKRYENSATAQITIRNREFDGTIFTIQLYNTAMNSGFTLIGNNYRWNRSAVNHRTTTFGSHSGNNSTFIALPRVYKENKFLGYEYIDRERAQVNVYALNYNHDYNQNRYLDWNGDYWKYPNTDTTVYVSGQGYYDRLYFKLDTAQNYSELEGYGFDPDNYNAYKIPYLVQLERQPYYLNFEDPYKLLCSNMFSMINGTQGEYAMGTREVANKHYLGTPIFNLRHVYHKVVNGVLTPYFALAQRLNELSYHRQYLGADIAAFEAYLRANYNSTMTTEIIDKLLISLGHNHTNNDGLKTGVFVARVRDASPNKLEAGLRLDEATIASTFRLVKDDDPIYRRFNTLIEADVADDTPKTLEFFWMDNRNYVMFENTGELQGQRSYWENYDIGTVKVEGKKNYLGYFNTNQYPDHNRAIYVDTAFIQRGTGDVKPQYLLVVDPKRSDVTMICDEWGDFHPVDENYLRGRFLINATDSARGVGNGINQNSVRAVASPTDPTIVDVNTLPIGRSYLWENNWERLVWTDAIHAYGKDALYLVAGVNLAPYTYPDTDIIDIAKLDAAAASTTAATSNTNRIRKIFLGNNNHKDAVWQMRLIERGAVEFILESETGTPEGISATGVNNNRKWGVSYGQLNSNGPMIAPCAGGWVKEQNGTAVISRSDMVHNLAQALKMDVRRTEDFPTSNEDVTITGPTVIGDYNAVTILGAAGKKVVISNVLGQTVAGTVLSSDNATIATPKGVIIVAIEGEAAVKTLVK